MDRYLKDIVQATGRIEPTPKEAFFNRRDVVAGLGVSLLGIAAGGEALAQPQPQPQPETEPDPRILKPPILRKEIFPAKRNEAFALPAYLDQTLTPRLVAATHNNFYEFLPGRGGPAWQFADKFEVDPWKVEVKGLCKNPMTLDLDDLFEFPHEERLYHFRCVERWAMNVPWSGFPLSKLIEKAQPKKKAKFVRFVSAMDKETMPGISQASHYPWPYHEALRLDEAMNELAFVVTGAYGEPLLKQHGAPLRIAVPWKYGYKNPKSIVEIEFTDKQPRTFWQVQEHEYGFLSNVNPYIPHPRWSQQASYFLPDGQRFETKIFNGYERYVAELYPDEPRELQKALVPGQTAR